MAEFDIAYAPLSAFEGGWCLVEGDAGGETYAGISRRFFPEWPGWGVIDAAKRHYSFGRGARAFTVHLASIPGLADQVRTWFRTEWWDSLGLSVLPQAVADELFEQAVNLGRGGSGRYLQRLCNAFNFNAATGRQLYPDLREDGVVGPRTLAALTVILAGRVPARIVIHALNALQAAHYVGLAAQSFANRQFVDGWLSRTV